MQALLAASLLPLALGLGLAQDPAGALDSLRAGAAGAQSYEAAPAVEGVAVGALAPAPGQLPTGKALLAALHELTGKEFRQHTYGEAQNYIFSAADNVLKDGTRGVIDAYSGVFVEGTSTEGSDYREQGDENQDGFIDKGGMNVEHVWPQSFFKDQLPMRADVHHLMATFIHPNGVRGSLPFCAVSGSGQYHNKDGAKGDQSCFEPPDETKGRVARALLYFVTRYYDKSITNGSFSEEFWNEKLDLILGWNRDFPPTREERSRNDRVQSFQGNRNPFVDDPGLADRIGRDAFYRVAAADASLPQ